MKLTKDNRKKLRIGDVLQIENDKYLITNVQPSGRYGNGISISLQNMETKRMIYLAPSSDYYGAEILYTIEGWEYRMKTLVEDIEKMDKTVTDDHNRYVESNDEDELEEFTISYRGQTISFPLDLAGFMNPVWELLEGIREEAEEQLD